MKSGAIHRPNVGKFVYCKQPEDILTGKCGALQSVRINFAMIADRGVRSTVW